MAVPKFSPSQIIGIDVFLERFQTRIYVGNLKKEKNKFIFSYDTTYLNMKNILPLGPEFPLTCQEFFADKIFPSFLDRLPDPESPSYPEDCTHVGIAITTTDPIILLARFKRGPSSFIFEPVYKNKYSYKDIEELKNDLGLSLQDFAYLFDVSLSALQKIKTCSTPGTEVLRQIELYLEVPEALEFQIQRNAKYLHPEKVKKALEFLHTKKAEKILMTKIWNILSYAELDYTQLCLKQENFCLWTKEIIKNSPKEKNLIEKINGSGFVPSSMSTLFEIRFAYALYKAGLSVQNEFKDPNKKSDIGDSSVDFIVSENSGTKWFIELTSMNESNRTKLATVSLENGVSYYFSDTTLPEDNNDVGTFERKKVCSVILSKIAKVNKDKSVVPIKFFKQEDKDDGYNIIIVDMRGYMSTCDEHEYKEILYGDKGYEKIYDESRNQAPLPIPILGLFNDKHPDLRSKYLQERIHGVGFVREKEYVGGELQTILELFRNPNFFNSDEELRELFPLKKDKNYNPASNPLAYRPPLED